MAISCAVAISRAEASGSDSPNGPDSPAVPAVVSVGVVGVVAMQGAGEGVELWMEMGLSVVPR